MIAPLAIAHAYLLAVGQATTQTELTLAQRAVRPLFPPSETGPCQRLQGSAAPEAHQPLAERHEYRAHEG